MLILNKIYVIITQEERHDVPGTVGRSGCIVADGRSLPDGTLDRRCARTRYVPRRSKSASLMKFAFGFELFKPMFLTYQPETV